MLARPYVGCGERANVVNELAAQGLLRWSKFRSTPFRLAPPGHLMAPEIALATAPRREAGRQFQSQGEQMQSVSFAEYKTDGFFDEMFDDKGWPRADCLPLCQRIRAMPPEDLTAGNGRPTARWCSSASRSTSTAIAQGTERIIPFDIIPRIVCRDEWEMLERGLRQRITALNMLIDDLYHDQQSRARWRAARACGRDCQGLPSAVRRPQSAARRVVPHHRHRPGARHRRPVLRAGRQSALPLRRVVRAAESAAHEADVSAAVRAIGDSARSTTTAAGCSMRCSI